MKRTHRTRLATLAVVVAVTTFAAACGGGGDDDGGGESGNGGDDDAAASGADECTEDRAGGEITVGTFGTLAGFDPVMAPASGTGGGLELAAVFDTLVRWDPETSEHEPWVAESLEPNDDFTEWTLGLRDGVRFGDGSPLDAEAVRFNVERHQDPANTSRALALTGRISEVEVVDDLTVVFRLSEPWTQFPYLLANEPGMIVNPAQVEALGEGFPTMPTGGGAGPYEVARFAPGEEIVLEAKDDYWDGPVCIQQIRFVQIAGGQATYDAFGQGEVDVALLREPRVAAQVRDDGVEHTSTPDSAGAVILINNGVPGTDPPTADVRVRQAVAHAIDVDLFNERINDGNGLPTSALIDESSRYFQDLEGPAYDPDRASELVEEVVAEGAWDGGIRLQCGDTPAGTESGVLFEAMLEAVGFDVTVESVDSATSLQRVIVEHNYDLACWGLGIREANPWVTLFNNLSSESPANYVGYENADMDRALEDMREATSLDQELEALETIQELWNETAPSAVFESSENLTIWQDDVHNLEFTQNWMTYFDDAYIEP
jgi:peptide/nickel transport system substrate-binding protein